MSTAGISSYRVSSYRVSSYRVSNSRVGSTVTRRSAHSPRLRLTKRGRAVLMAVAATPLVIAALTFALNGGGAAASLDGSSASFQYITVGNGETLWQVAQQVAPNADPRDVIDQIVQLNELASADVFAGEHLAIPSQYVH
jgi:hypothetical protein